MADRPILFSAPMVRALLAGTKTQTRRVVKPQPSPELLTEYANIRAARGSTRTDAQMLTECLPCPYGEPGDRLWVRETFAGSIAYERHGYPLKEWGNKLWYIADGEPRSGQWTRPKPSIHMPRCLSRITLEVTGVRVERLQDISIADAMAEGVVECAPRLRGLEPCMEWRYAYEDLWTEINGPGSWDANPWVWVLEFRRAASAQGEKE